MQCAVMDDAKRDHPLIAHFFPMARDWAKRRWCAWIGVRPQTRQGREAIYLRCWSSRMRLGAARARTDLSIPPASRRARVFFRMFPAQDLLAIKAFEYIGIMDAMPGLERRPDRAQ